MGLECSANILCKENKALAYIRYAKGNPLNVKELLANSEDIPKILDYLIDKNSNNEKSKIDIAIPEEKIKSAVEKGNSFKVIDKFQNYNAFMIKVLGEKSSMATYCEQVEKNIVKPGIIIFPAIFDIDDGRTE